MTEKLNHLKLPRNFSYWPVLIHAGEVSDAVVAAGYFKKIIDFTEFLT